MSRVDHPQVVVPRHPPGFDLRRFTLMLALMAAPVILCLMTLWATNRELRTALEDHRQTEAEVQQLRIETERLKEEIRGLREDRQVIERIAREELHMLRPDEVIISFPDAQKLDRLRRR